MTIYSDAGVMIRDIIGYLRVCPDANIIPADDPDRQTVGYIMWSACENCPAISWEIPLTLVRYPPGGVRHSVLRDYLQSNARWSLIEDLRRQAAEGTMTAEQALEERSVVVVTDTEELQRVVEAAVARTPQRIVKPMAPFRHAPFWGHEISTEFTGILEPGTIVTLIHKDNETFSKVALPDGRTVTMSNCDLEEPGGEPGPPVTRYDLLGKDEP